jgi:hypothetical protein
MYSTGSLAILLVAFFRHENDHGGSIHQHYSFYLHSYCYHCRESLQGPLFCLIFEVITPFSRFPD